MPIRHTMLHLQQPHISYSLLQSPLKSRFLRHVQHAQTMSVHSILAERGACMSSSLGQGTSPLLLFLEAGIPYLEMLTGQRRLRLGHAGLLCSALFCLAFLFSGPTHFYMDSSDRNPDVCLVAVYPQSTSCAKPCP